MTSNPYPRRRFLQTAAAAAIAATPLARRAWAQTAAGGARPRFPDSRPIWPALWDAALITLAGNVHTVPAFPDNDLLFEGAVYPGMWMECGPLEALVYASLFIKAPQDDPLRVSTLKLARNNHAAFFHVQTTEGQFPSNVKPATSPGLGQIQMVVPIAATALETAMLMKAARDPEAKAFLQNAYDACGRWDAWLRRYRDTRGTGLVEGFCTYDSGMDNSPRWAGIPNRCPDSDARKSPALPGMPRLCPDLSATTYGARVALAEMATQLGRKPEANRWREEAEVLRRRILDKLWCEEDASFYDLDSEGKFVRVRSIVNCRVLGEHVLKLDQPRDKHIFDQLWSRQLSNPKAFWTPFPFPSSAIDDPTFVRPIPRNSWGGASQALTALRTPRWMAHYGRAAEHRTLMHAWLNAMVSAGEKAQSANKPLSDAFRQQTDPVTGDFTEKDPGGYSPAALVYLDFARRLSMA